MVRPAVAVELAQDRDHAVGLGRPQPRHHLVEQQKSRPGRQRPGDFEALAVRQRQRRGDAVALVEEIEPLQQRAGMRARRADIAAVQQRADDDIVLDAQGRERPHDLKGAGDAAPAHRVGRKPGRSLAGEGDRAFARRQRAGDHVEQRGLAGAVRSDDGEDRALGHLEADTVDRDQAAEALADALQRKQRAHLGSFITPSRRASGGHTPSGSTTMTMRRQTP